MSPQATTVVARFISYKEGALAAKPKKQGARQKGQFTVCAVTPFELKSIVDGADDRVRVTAKPGDFFTFRSFCAPPTSIGRLFTFTGVGVEMTADHVKQAIDYKPFADAVEVAAMTVDTLRSEKASPDEIEEAQKALMRAEDLRDYDDPPVMINGERKRRGRGDPSTHVCFSNCTPYAGDEARLLAEESYEARRLTHASEGKSFSIDVDFSVTADCPDGMPLAPGAFVRDESFGLVVGTWNVPDVNELALTYAKQATPDVKRAGLGGVSTGGFPCDFLMCVRQISPTGAAEQMYVATRWYEESIFETQMTMDQWSALAPVLLPYYRGFARGKPSKKAEITVQTGNAGGGVVPAGTAWQHDSGTWHMRAGIEITREEAAAVERKDANVSYGNKECGAVLLNNVSNVGELLTNPEVRFFEEGNWMYDAEQREELSKMTPADRAKAYASAKWLSRSRQVRVVWAVHPRAHVLLNTCTFNLS